MYITCAGMYGVHILSLDGIMVYHIITIPQTNMWEKVLQTGRMQAKKGKINEMSIS